MEREVVVAMKYFATMLVLLFATTTAASAVEMPKELIGEWCSESSNKYQRCKLGEYSIAKAKIAITDDWLCVPFEIRKIQDNVWAIRGRCTHAEGIIEIFTSQYMRKGAYLYITEK
jgi:hypothetical protein